MKTKKYDMFTTVSGNRDIDNSHVYKLIRSISRNNLLAQYPILVNNKMEVIDGQHRLEAAKQMNEEIHYNIVNGLEIQDIMEINSSSKKWALQDYVDAYVKLGNEHYIKLQNFIEKYNFSVGMSAQLMHGTTISGGGYHYALNLKTGKFEVKTEEEAHRIAGYVMRLKEHAVYPIEKDREFMRAIRALSKNPVFDFNRLLNKLDTHYLEITRQADKKLHLLRLEELYNYKSSKPVELFASSQKYESLNIDMD